MAKYSGSEDIYRELVDDSEENWLYGLVAFAIIEEQHAMKIYGAAGIYVGVVLPEGFVVDIFDEFGMTQSSEANVEAILRLREDAMPDGSRGLSLISTQSELKRYKVLSETLDVEEEQTRIADEIPEVPVSTVPVVVPEVREE